MDGSLSIGSQETLEFALHWADAEPRGNAANATRGGLIVRVGGRTVWGSDDNPFEWTWVELIEHFARYWPYLFIEEGDPLGLGVPPERLRNAAEQRWTTMIEEHRDREEELLWSYLEAHDVSSAIQGAYPAPLWLTREGTELRIECKEVVRRMPVLEAKSTLAALGTAIVDRLEGLNDERARAAVLEWENRERVAPTHLAQIATGLPKEALELIAGSLPVNIRHLRFEQAFESDEYLAVARMTNGALPIEELPSLFMTMQAQPQVWTGTLDRMADQLGELMSTLQRKPAFEQGRAAARWFRERRLWEDETRVEPEDLLAEWKIPVVNVQLSSRDLDAVSIWGSARGPAVIVNRGGRRGRMNGRRATISHEIAHLLLDRHAALPVAEVMGGRMSSQVEGRANAFAAELLVPARIAGQTLSGARNQRQVEDAVRRMSEFYGASREVVAWQARNAAGIELSPATISQLRAMVSNPAGF